MKHCTMGLLALLLSASVWAAGGWHDDRYYQAGERVQYHGQWYEALQSHEAVKGAGWSPDAAPSLWRKISRNEQGGGQSGWREGVSYRKGTVVFYRGQPYRCLQSHKAERGAGWSPDRAPSLWASLAEKETRPM